MLENDDEYQSFGGHLFEATVAVTVECCLEIFDFEFVRLKGAKNKFRPISF